MVRWIAGGGTHTDEIGLVSVQVKLNLDWPTGTVLGNTILTIYTSTI